MGFLKKLKSRIQELILKLIGSRKSFFMLLNAFLTVYLIKTSDPLNAIIAFGVFNISNFVYMSIIKFEKVDLDISVNR